MPMIKLFIGIIVTMSLVLINSRIYARPLCEITQNKKDLIYSTLCGQAAQETVYRFSGVNCAKNSIKRRMDDSAIQVLAYEMCGDRNFSEQLRSANIRAVAFMQTLSVCTPELIDVSKIFDEALRDMRTKAGRMPCTMDLRQTLEQRRPYFRTMIEQANSKEFLDKMFALIGVDVDGVGNVRER